MLTATLPGTNTHARTHTRRNKQYCASTATIVSRTRLIVTFTRKMPVLFSVSVFGLVAGLSQQVCVAEKRSMSIGVSSLGNHLLHKVIAMRHILEDNRTLVRGNIYSTRLP